MRIVVSDNGTGIPAERLTKIFEKFEQASIGDQRNGSGLGLAFSKLAAEAHGGRIWAESIPGKGSSFFVALPILKEAPPHELSSLSRRPRTNQVEAVN